MKRLFLASAVNEVANDIAKKVDCKGLKLAFILTASEVEKGDLWWMRADRKALVDIGFDVFDYTLTNKTKDYVKKDLEKADFIKGLPIQFYLHNRNLQINRNFDQNLDTHNSVASNLVVN